MDLLLTWLADSMRMLDCRVNVVSVELPELALALAPHLSPLGVHVVTSRVFWPRLMGPQMRQIERRLQTATGTLAVLGCAP